MGDPSRSAGGTPDDWAGGSGGSKKSGCDNILGLILLVGLVQVLQMIGWLHQIGLVIT